MAFLIGSEPAQTNDVIAHFVLRFVEIFAQDPLRTGDALRFEQFTTLLIWIWERYYDLLFKYAALARTARAAGAKKPAFVDAVVTFIVQLISKPQATPPYIPGTTILPAPPASPLRTSAQASPTTRSEPAYIAHHAPYVFSALLERTRPTREDCLQLDAKLIVTLVSASRSDITKWKCFKVLTFLLEEVPEVANGILLGKGDSDEKKATEKREQMKGLIGCVVAHLKPESSYQFYFYFYFYMFIFIFMFICIFIPLCLFYFDYKKVTDNYLELRLLL
jgi:hypothetical protein